MGSELEEGSSLCGEVPEIPLRYCSDFVQLCFYWQRSAVVAFGLWSYLVDGFPQLLHKTTEEQWQSAAARAPW